MRGRWGAIPTATRNIQVVMARNIKTFAQFIKRNCFFNRHGESGITGTVVLDNKSGGELLDQTCELSGLSGLSGSMMRSVLGKPLYLL